MTTQIDENLTADRAEIAGEMLRLLGDPSRLRIVWVLLHGEHSVNELADHVGMNAAAVSQHLAKLRLARLVCSRRDGNRIFYLVENAHVRRLVEEAISHVEHVVLDLPDHETPEPSPSAQGEIGRGESA